MLFSVILENRFRSQSYLQTALESLAQEENLRISCPTPKVCLVFSSPQQTSFDLLPHCLAWRKDGRIGPKIQYDGCEKGHA